jgi:hypothetical protein
MRSRWLGRGVVLGLACLGVGLSVAVETATAAAVTRPNPPKQICIGSNCATTSAASGKIKWNPGNYGASGGYIHPRDPLSRYTGEMDDMLKDDWIRGYRAMVTWAALDIGPVTFTQSVGKATNATLTKPVDAGSYWALFANGEYRQITLSDTTTAAWSSPLSSGNVTTAHLYDTQLLDQILNRLKTHYKTQKQFVIAIVPDSFSGGSRKPGENSRIPAYITNDPAYGKSPDPASYGWWGPPLGTTTGWYVAALWRPAVAAQYAALGAALGAKYDSDPNFEGIMDSETSQLVAAATNFPPADPSYSDDAYVAQAQMFLTAWVAAFPHTNVVCENTFLHTPTPTQKLEQWIMQNRIAPGTADVSGQSYYDANPSRTLSNWGLAAYAGVTVTGSSFSGSDMRGTVRPMVDVQSPDIGAGSGTPLSNSPLDIVTAINKTVKASHAFWSYYAGGKAPRPTWANITAVLKDNPLTNVGYPGNYP